MCYDVPSGLFLVVLHHKDIEGYYYALWQNLRCNFALGVSRKYSQPIPGLQAGSVMESNDPVWLDDVFHS